MPIEMEYTNETGAVEHYIFRDKISSIDYMAAMACIPVEFQLNEDDQKAAKDNNLSKMKLAKYESALQITLIASLSDDMLTIEDLEDDPVFLAAVMAKVSPLIVKFMGSFSSLKAVTSSEPITASPPEPSSTEEIPLPSNSDSTE